MPRRRKRLDPSSFNLPVEQIKAGFYTDVYFQRARDVLRHDGRSPRALMQVTGKGVGWLGGIDETIALLKLCADDWSALTVNALFEGDWFDEWETVLTIEGPYDTFAHLETLYLGVLGRRTNICTNAREIVEAAESKPVLMFGARDDHFLVQPGDGYSAMVAGIKQVSTEAQASLFGGKPVGTIPHALIAAYKGDTLKATQKFLEIVDKDVQVIALVDYDNDCVKTS